MSAYGRPFSCRTALFLFSPPLSPVESVDLGVLSSPLARLLRLLPLVPSSSLSELRRGRDPARRLRRKKEVRQRLDERTEESDGATRLDGDGSRDPEHLREEIRPGPSCSSEKINLMLFLCSCKTFFGDRGKWHHRAWLSSFRSTVDWRSTVVCFLFSCF